jgi:hypothetical protein
MLPGSAVLAVGCALGLAAAGDGEATRVRTLDEIAPAIVGCWRPPQGLLGFERLEITARFSLRRDGSLMGEPAITFASAEIPPRARELLTRSVREAIRACTPLNLTDGLGQAVAGRPFSVRFVHTGRPGRGA